MLLALPLQVALFYGLLVYAQSSLQLGYIPLAVKTPYLQGWISSNSGTSPERTWPNFYMIDREFGWAGFVRVDNQAFQWMGDSANSTFSSTVTSSITPTKSVFRIEAGPIQFNVTFFTPIEPNDYVRQSMPFSYMYIDGFSSNDSQPHTVQMYSDISAQWVTRSDTTQVVWDTIETNDTVYHRVTRENPQSMVDNDNFAEDGVGYYAMLQQSNLTWQTCADIVCRGTFSQLGILNNTKDTNFRPVGGTTTDSWPVYAFSVDLGTISPGSQPDAVVSALGLVRDPLVTYTTESSVQNRSSYYLTEYATPAAAITAFLQDFSDAQSRNSQLDDQIMDAATKFSPLYAEILAFVPRQLFASMDITVPSIPNRGFNTSDIRIFMKDMGRSTRANPVDVIYGAFPALLYFNSSTAAGLLEPLLETMSSPAYRNPYAAPDLGSRYPIINGNFSDTHTLGVDSSSSLVIMVYAHAVKSGDGSLLQRYYSTLQIWTDYLISNDALHPPQGSVTQDRGMNAVNLSNEALKSILAIYCMGKINDALGIANSTYKDQATQQIEAWKQLAISGDHIVTVYGEANSWGLIYNLFPAIWLNTGLIEDDILNNQAQFYVHQTAGLDGFALDSTDQSDRVYPHWTLWTAASIPSNFTSIRDTLVGFVNQRVYSLGSHFPLPMTWPASSGVGDGPGLAGSAIHGAAFSILALGMQNVDINANVTKSASSSSNKTRSPVGPTVGGIVGGIAGAVILAFALVFFWRRRNRQRKEDLVTIDPIEAKPHPFNLASYGSYSTVNTDSNADFNETANMGGNHWSPDMEGIPQPQQREADIATDSQSMIMAPRPPAPRLSSKQREALGMRPYQVTHVAAPSVSAASTLSNPHSASALTNPYSSTASGSVTEDLRVEVERLRTEMESIRRIAEPPPGYA